MWSLTLTRAALSLPDLVIDNNPFGTTFHVPEDGFEWPRFDTRRLYAPESGVMEGRILLAAGREVGVLTATIYAHAATTALLLAAQAELEAATSQWSYTVTLTLDGETVGSWTAQPERPSWGEMDSGMVRAHMSRATIAIPLNPGSA